MGALVKMNSNSMRCDVFSFYIPEKKTRRERRNRAIFHLFIVYATFASFAFDIRLNLLHLVEGRTAQLVKFQWNIE